MSFSSEVKKEAAHVIPGPRHCRIAELAAIISFCGRIRISQENRFRLWIHTENLTVAGKYYILVKKTFGVSPEVSVRDNRTGANSRIYTVSIPDPGASEEILTACRLLKDHGIEEELSIGDNLIVQNLCCKRAFLRGAFLSAGSISNPEKSYHLEFVAATKEKAAQIQELLSCFQVEAKCISRKKYYVVYLKDGTQIVDVLSIIDAHVALMNLENVRILKEVRNTINRQVNCETANIQKTVDAAGKQLEDIRYVESHLGFGNLPGTLAEIAAIRLEHPEASLLELGKMLHPPIGKSGVNHRLRKLGSIATELRDNSEGG